MKNIFKDLSIELWPDFFHQIEWKNVWNKPLSSGCALEWYTFLALAKSFEIDGWKCSFPLHGKNNFQFTLRNEIPYHYNSKPGHSNVGGNLAELFLAALTPKMVVEKNEVVLSVYREGFPYNRLYSPQPYSDRPDIVIAYGAPADGYPYAEDNVLTFKYQTRDSAFNGQLRIINSPVIPLISRNPVIGALPKTVGLIECSMNKTVDWAEAQLTRYSNIFQIAQVNTHLITCNRLETHGLNHHFLDIQNPDLNKIQTDFMSFCKSIVEKVV